MPFMASDQEIDQDRNFRSILGAKETPEFIKLNCQGTSRVVELVANSSRGG